MACQHSHTHPIGMRFSDDGAPGPVLPGEAPVHFCLNCGWAWGLHGDAGECPFIPMFDCETCSHPQHS